MSRRSLLSICVGTIFFLCAAGLVILLGTSMSPNPRAKAAMPRIPVADLAPGSYKIVPSPWSTPQWGYGILLIRRQDSRINAWFLTTRDGVPHMPDRHWWRPGEPCPGFTVNFEKNAIECPAEGFPEEAGDTWQRYRWSLGGRYLGKEKWIPDLERIPGREELGDLVLYLRDDE